MRQILVGLGRVHPTQSGISLGEPDHIISCGCGCQGTSICACGFVMLQTMGTLVQIYCIWVDLGLLTAGVKPSMYALGGLCLSKRTK